MIPTLIIENVIKDFVHYATEYFLYEGQGQEKSPSGFNVRNNGDYPR